MVATDVASRGIGMIDHNPPLLPHPYVFVLVFLTIDVVWKFVLLSTHCSYRHASAVTASMGPLPRKILGPNCSLPLEPSGCSVYSQVSKRREGVSLHHFSKLQFQGFP
jgi:hypothetical protein